MTNYILKEGTRDKIKDFIQPFVNISSIIDNPSLSTDYMNMLLALLGKFPAALVFPIIEDLRSGVNPITDESTS